MNLNNLSFEYFHVIWLFIAFVLTSVFFLSIKNLLNKYEVSVIDSSVGLDNGWYHVKFDILKKDKHVKKALLSFRQNTMTEKEWVSGFKEFYFEKIHYRDHYGLFTLCKELHEDVQLTQENIDNVKRIITASGILFNFKIPAALWLLDSICLELVLKYSILCEKTVLDLDKFKINDFTDNNGKNFFNIIKAIPQGFIYISKMCVNDRSPNITHLFHSLKKNNNKLYLLLNEDIDNLKRLLTVCYALLGLDIPKDYIFVDENVYNYIHSPEKYKEKKSHLSVVK